MIVLDVDITLLFLSTATTMNLYFFLPFAFFHVSLTLFFVRFAAFNLKGLSADPAVAHYPVLYITLTSGKSRYNSQHFIRCPAKGIMLS